MSDQESSTRAPMTLGLLGRCCGRKPLVYKRDGFLFCPRCDRAYSLADGKAVENWAYTKDGIRKAAR